MDNFSDIIVLLVMVVATIIGALSKSKSKRQADQTPQRQEPDYTYDDSMPEYRDEIEMVETKVVPIEVASKQPERERLKMKTTHMPDHSEDVKHVLDDFDIRNAVIYSEILKPKFEE